MRGGAGDRGRGDLSTLTKFTSGGGGGEVGGGGHMVATCPKIST
jgi:hypothetical protein